MNLPFAITLLAALTVFCIAALAFILCKPAAWSALVEKENNFWVGRGWVSQVTADKIKKLEKGWAPKVILGVAAVIGLSIVVMALNFMSHRNLKAALPPHVKPVPQRTAQPAPAKAPRR